MKTRMITFMVSIVLVISAVSGALAPSFASDLSNVASTTPSGIPFSELEEAIDEYVSEYIGKTVPGAAIAVVKDGEIIFSKGYGYSDVEAQQPVNIETTVFEWGSITKLFTWTAAMQLAEEGKLDLDADIRTYLPEDFLKTWTYKQPVTMRHLMNHTAGFGDYGFDLIYEDPNMLGSLEEDLLKSHPVQYFEVGTASAYSNYGTALAGYVIENISGMSYDEYLKENFYDVLGMEDTTADRKFDVPEEMKDRKAKGYKPTGETGYTETIWSYVGLGPAGSLNGTIGDLAKFAIALTPESGMSTPIFNERETLDKLLTPTYMMTANGFFEFDGEFQSFGHGGNTAGFTGQFAVVPEERFGVVTLTNVKGEFNIGYGIQEMMIGKKVYAVKSDALNLPDSKQVEGQYLSYRRFEGSFLEILSYVSPLAIEATGENEIKATLSGLEARYVQTAPYEYKITGRDIPLFNMAFPVLKFEMQNGEVRQLTTGHGFDLAPVPAAKGSAIQLGSAAIFVLGVVLALSGLVIMIRLALRDRKKAQSAELKKMKKIHGLTVVMIIATINNTVVCMGKFMANSFMSFESMKPFILTNYVLFAGAVLLGGYAFKNWSSEGIRKRYQMLLSGSLITLAGLFAVMLHWNFFVLH